MGYTPAWLLPFLAFIPLTIRYNLTAAFILCAVIAFCSMCVCNKFLNNKWRWW